MLSLCARLYLILQTALQSAEIVVPYLERELNTLKGYIMCPESHSQNLNPAECGGCAHILYPFSLCCRATELVRNFLI